MRMRKLTRYAVCLIVLIVATDWALAQSQPAPNAQAAPQGRAAALRDLLYVASPGSHEAINGMGILVFDVKNDFRLVKRIPTWDFPASHEPVGVFSGEEVRGIAAGTATGMLYLTTAKRIAAFDLMTEKKVWEESPEGKCCDRQALSPDGKTLYVPSAGGTRRDWYVLDAMTGKQVKKLDLGGSVGPHNTIYSLDGSRVFMEGTASKTVFIADAKTHTVVQTVGPFSDMVRPFTLNGSGTLLFANVDNLLGFEVGDVRTGKMIHRVEVTGYGWSMARGPIPHGCPSHGIALSPDEKELWLADGVNGYVHVFDATVMPPKQKMSIRTKLDPVVGIGWLSFGLDGRYVYTATGDVIDVATKKIIAGLTDEFGRPVNSEKIVEIAFSNGKPVRATDQFGVGLVRGAPTN
jgi:WD40 repeat protein